MNYKFPIALVKWCEVLVLYFQPTTQLLKMSYSMSWKHCPCHCSQLKTPPVHCANDVSCCSWSRMRENSILNFQACTEVDWKKKNSSQNRTNQQLKILIRNFFPVNLCVIWEWSDSGTAAVVSTPTCKGTHVSQFDLLGGIHTNASMRCQQFYCTRRILRQSARFTIVTIERVKS